MARAKAKTTIKLADTNCFSKLPNTAEYKVITKRLEKEIASDIGGATYTPADIAKLLIPRINTIIDEVQTKYTEVLGKMPLSTEEQEQSTTLKEGATATFRIKKNKLASHTIAAFLATPDLVIAPEQLMRSLFFDKDGVIHSDYIEEIKGKDRNTAAAQYLKGSKGVLDQAVIDGVLDFTDNNELKLAEGVTQEQLITWFKNLQNRNESVESKEKVAKAKTVAEGTEVEQKNISATGLMESEGSAVGQKRTQRKSVPKEVESKVTEIEQTLKKASIQINDETDSQLRTAEEELNDLVKLYDRDQFKTDVLEKALSKLRNLNAVRARAPHQRLYNKISNITKFFRNIKDAVKAVNNKKVKMQLNKDLTKILGGIQNATLARDNMKAELDTALNGVTDENARKEIYKEFQKRASDFSIEITRAVDKFMQDIGVKPKDFAVSVARAEAHKAELPSKLAKEKQQRELDNEAILDIVKELEDKTTSPKQRYELVQGLKETGTGFPTLDKLVSTFLTENKKTPKPSAFTTLASQIKASATKKAPVQGETLKKFEKTKDERDGTQVKVSTEEGAKRYYTETEGATSNKSIFNTQTKDGKVVSDAHNAFKQFIESKNNIGASRSIPKNIKGFVEQISKAFGLSDKLFITTLSDIKASALSELSSGAASIGKRGNQSVGTYIISVDGINLIVLNDTRISSDDHLLQTLSHEIGHAIIANHFLNAPMEVQLAIQKDFQNWVQKLSKTDTRIEALDELYQKGGATWSKFLKEYASHLTTKQGEYTGIKYTMFEEYLAEQVAKYIKTRESIPQGAVGKFFKNIADDIRKLFTYFSRETIKNRLPVPSVAQWLDGLQMYAQPNANGVLPSKDNISMASEIEGISVSKRQNLSAIDQLKGVLEKVGNVGTLIRKGVLLPGIQALEYREVYFAEQAKALAQGYPQATADRIARDAASNTKDGVVARILDENHLMDTEKAEVVNTILSDENNNPVYETALTAHNALSNPERVDFTDALYAGNNAKKEFTTKAELDTELGRKVSNETFSAYTSARTAINNIFKQSNLQRFNKVLDDVVGVDFGADVRSIVTKALYRNMSRNKRINYIKMEMDRLNYTNEQIKDIVASLPQGLIKEARRALNFYVTGGVEGAVAQVRTAKADSPFVVRIKENFTDAKGVDRQRDKLVKFFDTKAQADAYAKSLADDKVLQDVMAFDKTPLDSLKDANGKLQVSVTEETDAQLGTLYPRSEYVNRINESLIKNVTEELTNNASVTKEDAKRILRSVQAVQTKQFLARTNARFMRRKKHHILGYDYVNPLQNAYRDAEQTATFIARANYINRVVTFAGTQQGSRNIEALKEIKNSFTKYSGISASLSRTATASFMMYRIITAVAQAHQYFSFGISEMVASGVPIRTAIKTMTEDYLRVLMERGNISTVDLAKHMRGDKTLGKFMRSFMPKQSLSYLLESIGNKKMITLTKEEQQLLERHRLNRDTLDNVTKEINSLELANREGISNTIKDVRQGIVKTGMFLFNEMEVLNREAALIAMYKHRRTKGDNVEVADQKATDFMFRVNGDFNKYNKTLVMRKYPVLAPIFALTSFSFHALGLLGTRTKQALSGDINAQKSMLSFAALTFLLGGLKGEPLWDQMNRMFTMMFGKDHLLDLEKWAREGADTAVEKWTADMVSRGMLAATVGIDWTNNVSMRLPWVDAAMDIYSGKKQDIGQYGAGLSWLMGVYRAGKDVVSLDFQKAMEDINLGGISQLARGMRYKEEGYSKGQGPQFFGTEQRKLTEKQAKLYMMGLKPLELARTQDVIQSEVNVLDVYWKNKKRAAEKEFFKAIDKYVRNEKEIPEEVLVKAVKSINDFNADLLSRKPSEIHAVRPITTQAINQGARIRFTPNKAKALYERGYERLIKESDDTADSADIITE